MDAVVIIKHDSCNFFLDVKERLNAKFEFIDEWEIGEKRYCRNKGEHLIVGPAFQKNFVSLLQRWGDSGHHYLMMDYTNAGLAIFSKIMEAGGVEDADILCVSFFHSDEDTVKAASAGCEKSALGWKKWYMDAVSIYPFIHIEEIPYGFTLNEDYLQALFDREFPHSEVSRFRRVWKGNPKRRIEAALAREGAVPSDAHKTMEESAAKKKGAKNG